MSESVYSFVVMGLINSIINPNAVSGHKLMIILSSDNGKSKLLNIFFNYSIIILH
jgi:hypothetical protein